MNRLELIKLLEAKDERSCDLQKTDPQLWSAILVERANGLRAWALSTLKTSPPEIRERIASLDFSKISGNNPMQFILDSLEQAGVSPKVIQETISQLQGTASEEKPPDGNCQPIKGLPDVALLLEKARLFEVAQIAKLDAGAEAVVSALVSPGAINEPNLRKLIKASKLTDEGARELGLAASLYTLADENKGLAEVMRNVPLSGDGRKGTSTKDFAPLRCQEWETALTNAKVLLPQDHSAAEIAKGLADRFAQLHPEIAFVGRLWKMEESSVVQDVVTLKPLFEQNSGLLDQDFASLKTDGLSGEQKEKLAIAHANLQRLVRAYPGLQLQTVLERPDLPPATKAEIVSRRTAFIGRVQETLGERQLFNLDYTSGSPDLSKLGLIQAGATPEEEKLVIAALKAYQRSFHMTQHVDDAQLLINRGYSSSTDVANTDLARFKSVTGLNDDRAERYWKRARTSFLEQNLVLSGLLDLEYGFFNRIAVENIGTDFRDYLRRLDGYETLFGSLGLCTCRHCQSILSPAAYFVDLMCFAEEHIRPQFGEHTNHPLDLKTRRPDLWTLELTCANTNDRLPTLDIVNEILENFIARARGYTGRLDDRFAVGQNVYGDALLTAVNSFQQPFHLPKARVDAYLAKFDTSRETVATVLHAGDEAFASAVLKLSPEEARLIATANSNLTQLSGIYGCDFDASVIVQPPIEVQKLKARMGCSREELGELLATRFLSAGGATVFIRTERRDADSVQNDVENVHGLMADALDRLHRFTRLWRQLPWTVAELDRLLSALGVRTLEGAALFQVALGRHLQARLNISVDEICALGGDLPETPSGSSLIDELFNAPSVIVGAEGRLPDSRRNFTHPAFLTASGEANPIMPRLLSGLRVDIDGLAHLIRFLAPQLQTITGATGIDIDSPDESLRAFRLSVENLTLLYRHSMLARILKLPIDELFQLLGFANLPGRVRGLLDSRTLLDFYVWWKSSGYSLNEVAVATGAAVRDISQFPDPAMLVHCNIGI